jgi:putative hydrolase of the HAD superfamily
MPKRWQPNEEMGKVVVDLKSQGYKIYLCSNASVRLLTCYQMIPGIEHFDGILFSAEVKCIKPQKEIYHHFFERFHLNPEECFFIDDLPMNIEGAKACKMDGYCFADGDIKRLKEVLSQLNA